LVPAVLRGYPALPAAMDLTVHSQPPFQPAAAAALRHLLTGAQVAAVVVVVHTTVAAQGQADRGTPEAAAQR